MRKKEAEEKEQQQCRSNLFIVGSIYFIALDSSMSSEMQKKEAEEKEQQQCRSNFFVVGFIYFIALDLSMPD